MSGLSLTTPQALWALLLLVPLPWLALRSQAALGRRRTWSSLALRALAIAAASVALARPVQHSASSAVSTIALIDVSSSMSDANLREAEQLVRRLQPEVVLRFAKTAELADPAHLTRLAASEDTDLENALALAFASARDDARTRIVLFSDGHQTRGQAARALQGIPLYVQLPRAPAPAEVGLVEIAVPEDVQRGAPFALRARIAASEALHVRAELSQDGEPEQTRELDLEAGETSIAFRSLPRTQGSVRYRVALIPRGPDRFRQNNQLERAVEVHGAPRVLVVERDPAQAYALLDLLRAASFELELRTPEQAPRAAHELARFDFCILSDVPADALASSAQHALERYVADGGGLLLAGGEHAFGLGGYRGTPLEQLSAVALGSSARLDQASLALLLAIDKSGSMAGEKLERAKEAALATAALMPRDSYLGVLGFDAQPEQVARLSLGNTPALLARKIGTLAAGGGTAIFPALDSAYAALAGVRARVKHVVVLTDGQTQEESLTEIVRSMRADGITISTVGLGEEVNRGLLAELARLGSGRSYFTRDPAKVPRLFSEETQLVARSLAVEHEVRAHAVAQAEFLRGVELGAAPALKGYVASSARALPAQLILATDDGAPLLARMRHGRGWALAWTSDLQPRWASSWFSFRGFSRMLAQLVREHMRARALPALPIATRIEGDALTASLDVLDDRGRFVNDLTGRLELHDERGQAVAAAALVQDAPGRYQAALPAPGLGSFTLRAALARADAPSQPSYFGQGTLQRSFPAEYAPPFGPARAELAALAAQTGGRLLDPSEALPAPGGPAPLGDEERWPALVWLALAAFLLDVGVRRVRFPEREPPGRRRQGA